MKVEILRTRFVGDLIEVRFKYWNEKECACNAKKVIRTFDHVPSSREMLESV